MTNIRLQKEKISVRNIGPLRFWIGIVTGLVTAIAISLAYNQTRELFRLMTGISAELLIPGESESAFYNFFFSLLSTVSGLSMTIWIWMGNNAHTRKKDRLFKQLSRTNALLIFWIILMVITRFGTIVSLILYGSPGYDNHLNLYEDFRAMFVLLAVVLFMHSWFAVRLVYLTGKWILISLIICLITAFVLHLTTRVNQEKLNEAYFKRFESEYSYINSEIQAARTEYGIEFDAETIEVLKKRFTERSFAQIRSVRNAFAEDKPVSMDTMILQKIIIRNFKKYYGTDTQTIGYNTIEKWHFAQPEDILKQIQYYDYNSDQTKELFEILKEQIDLVNTPDTIWKKPENFSDREIRRSGAAENSIPDTLIQQLKKVRIKLMEDDRYSDLKNGLPEIRKRTSQDEIPE